MEKVVKVYHKKSGVSISSKMYALECGCYLNHKQMHSYLKSVPDFSFVISPINDLPLIRAEESYYLMQTIKSVEPTIGDSDFLNRVIRNGGLLNYIRKLEAACG